MSKYCVFRYCFKKHTLACLSDFVVSSHFLILFHSMFPCIISFSSLSLPSSSDSAFHCSLSLSLPSSSQVYCSIFHLLLPVSHPPFIAFLSSLHLTELGSSSKSPKAQSSTIILIRRAVEGLQKHREMGGERH